VQDRPYDFVFIGSCFEDNAEYLDKEQRAFYDYMLSHPELTFEQGLKEVLYAGELKTEKEYFDKDEFIEKMIAMKPACRMVIGHFRQAVIETILQAGYTLHVYGDDWNRHRLQEGYKLVIHPQVTVEESVKELKKAKIGLNIMSWHKSGMTERIANIMLSGAVCLSEKTSYLTENMMQGEDIMCFDLTELDKLPAMISGLLENDELRKKIAENAYRLAKDRYTWKSRAKALIELTETRSSII
jgi:spore maturation protein CgeB